MRLRPFRHGDENAIADICLRTGDSGADATALYRSPGLLGDVFALPYVAHHPENAFVLEEAPSAGIPTVRGYIVCTPDTSEFEEWFRTEWWPSRVARHVTVDDESRDAATLRYAAAVGTRAVPFVDEYPAHLHIDLLPDVQGRGWGRKLIAALVADLARRGVPGLQLTTGMRNTGAIEFYTRLGFEHLRSDHDAVTFGMRLGVKSGD